MFRDRLYVMTVPLLMGRGAAVLTSRGESASNLSDPPAAPSVSQVEHSENPLWFKKTNR